MERWTYQRPFELVEFPPVEEGGTAPHLVVLADYVTTEDGTGLVHQSPAFGEDDMEVCRAYGLPVVVPVRSDGHFADDIPLVGGQFFKHADADLVRDLESRGLMFRHVPYEHSYPHCWRCHTALMYYAQPSWYVRTTADQGRAAPREREDQLVPRHDQARPLRRLAGEQHRLGALAQPLLGHAAADLALRARATRPASARCAELVRADRHRPVRARPAPPVRRRGDLRLPDLRCGEARRVPEVIDAWFDSGSMPFAQWGYPHVEGSAEMLEQAYPADFICEAIDQTRGWFYTLMAVGTLVFDESSYRERAVPRATSWPRTAARCPSTSATSSSRSR